MVHVIKKRLVKFYILLVFAASFRDDYAERDGKEPTTTPLSERQYLGADSLVVGKGVIGKLWCGNQRPLLTDIFYSFQWNEI